MRACAYIVGPQDGAGAALLDMARGMGFEHVAPYAGIVAAEAQAAQTPVCFFLFAAVDSASGLRAHAEAIRFCATRRLRFSPLIYFSESPSAETIRLCIAMGFDDVITLPFTQARLEERLARQVGQAQTYYETQSYFGPDRRGRTGSANSPAERRRGGPYRRLEIMRNLTTGITVLRDEHFVAA